MSEYILPVSPQPTSATASSSDPSISQTGPLSPVDKCGLQRDALRGIMMELKRNVKTLQERQDAFHRCMTGRSLTDTQPQAGFDSVKTQMISLAEIVVALDRIAFATGIKIDGN
jgi:hypothetical protein